MKYGIEWFKELESNCEKCYGFCCVALYFSKIDGFPQDKKAGVPCINLQKDFKCKVHSSLNKKGFRGCISYDCFGAGQKVAKMYKERSWIENKKDREEMFNIFLVVKQINEILWYLKESYLIEGDGLLKDEIWSLINETEKLLNKDRGDIINLDIDRFREQANKTLRKVSEGNIISKGKKQFDYMGRDLRKKNLKGQDMRGTLLIGANLEGCNLDKTNFQAADMRGTNLKEANLEKSIFITQGQVNSALGNSNTKIPKWLKKPVHWI